VLNNRTQKKERVTRLYQMHANKQNPKKEIGAGDICAVVGMKELRTGDTITAVNKPLILESIEFPEPVIGVAIEPRTQADIDKLGIALGKLAEEDPTFQVRTNHETGQTLINGMGELHLDILLDRLKREFKVECNVGQPQVNYKEALTAEVKHREVFKKQTGGRGKFADIEVIVGPAEDGVKDLQFGNEVKGGNVPREYIPSVEKGFKNAMTNGPLAGFAVEGLKVTLLDGSYHPVDSDQLSFEICARQAFKKASAKAKPVLLEPIMAVEVVTPEEYMGDVISDLNKRRGQVEGMDSKAGARVIKAKVPLSEQFGYVTVLRTLSSGRAVSSMEFSHYEPMPDNLANEVLEKATGKALS
jgi:elongation factor G